MLYEYQCQTCGTDYEAYRPVARHAEGPECCGEMSKQVIRTAPLGFVDNMADYICPVTMTGVTTRRQRNEIMARHDLVDANDLLQTKEQRQAKRDAYLAERKRIDDERKNTPAEVSSQVERWAGRTVDKQAPADAIPVAAV